MTLLEDFKEFERMEEDLDILCLILVLVEEQTECLSCLAAQELLRRDPIGYRRRCPNRWVQLPPDLALRVSPYRRAWDRRHRDPRWYLDLERSHHCACVDLLEGGDG